MKNQTIEVDGINMRSEETGEGPAVVFVHGIPTGPRLWRHVIPRVSGARCLAWEMVGYGESIPEGRDRDISVAQQAEYLAAWMRKMKLQKPILVGHDLGGGVVQILAVKYPERAGGLVLMNSICYNSWPIPSVKMMSATGRAMQHLPDPIFEQLIRTFLMRGHETTEQASEAFSVHWPHYEAADGAAAFIRQVQALNVEDTQTIASGLPQLQLPARVVWGAADKFQKIEYGERLARDLDAQLDRIEDGEHFVPEDHPERVAGAILAVLDERRESSAA